jgi:pimeloyl-ACP methyl ester carboxylesterase
MTSMSTLAHPSPAHHTATANGIRIHFVRCGNGPPLLLLHGWPEFWMTWRRCLPLLADAFTLIVPDLRGFGDTEKPASGPSDQATADILAMDILALADQFGLRRIGLVGHDVGAYAAQSAARRAPERIAGLFFFNCPYAGVGARWAAPEHLREIWYQSFHQLDWAAALVGASREACRTYIGHFLRHWSRDPHAFDDDLEAWVDNFMKPGNLQGGFNWYISAHQARLAAIRGDSRPLPPIATPTRVLWGAHDPILKAEWRDRLGEYFSDIEVGVAETAGHFVHYEAPEAAAAAIRAFFEGPRVAF